MAKISLRLYNREIEGLIEHGQRLDEAIAHCRQILTTYPKHLETYRLLGKAYLEAKRYDQAVDIFQRVLVVAPDDFVSHVGMSIIADDKGKLDDAIWHMERAFEVQPSNAAIQGELQRLFGRRDGVEPPKIRLTRGALAHMYVQGELYNQAISEIRAVLANDPKRTDMQTLLAQAYFRNGQKTEATDICTELLARFPNCLDANRLMVEILPGTQRADSAQQYRERVIELDPYAAFVQDSIFHSENVADSAVSLERLEYTGERAEVSGALGIGLESDTASSGRASAQGTEGSMGNAPEAFRSAAGAGDLPSWLRGTADDSTARGPAAPSSASPSQGKDDLPDFLRQAGWGSSSGEAQDTASAFSPEQTAGEPLGDAAVEGDLPEWVKALAPRGEGESPSQTIATSPASDVQASPSATMGSTFSADTPDWLRNLGAEEPTLPAPSIPEPPSPATKTPPYSADTPDWLRNLGKEEPEQPAPSVPQSPSLSRVTPSLAPDTPDWLRNLGAEGSEQPAPSMPETPSPSTGSPSFAPDTPGWLRKLEAETPNDVMPPAAETPEESPDWLKELAGRELDEPAAPTKAASESDWLGGVAAPGQGSAVQAEPLAEESPDWLKDFSNDLESPIVKAAPPTAPTPQPINSEPPSTLGSLGTTSQEQDDAMAWLEGLAAKHGAKPEELVTDPNARTEVAPDWVDKAKEIGEQAQAPTQPPATPHLDQTGIWLRNLDTDATESIIPQAAPPQAAEQAPSDFRSTLADQNALAGAESKKEEPPIMGESETPDWFSEFTREPAQHQDLDDAPDWLRGISRDSAEPESGVPEEAFPGSMSAADLTTKSLQDMPGSASAPSAEAHPMSDEISDLPAWLAGLDKDEAPITSPGISSTPSEDLPAWLQSEAEPEPQATAPANPSDWRPVQQEPSKIEQPVAEPKPEPLMEEPAPAAPPPAPKPVERAAVSTPITTRLKPASVSLKAATVSLGDAQSQLGRGNIAAALDIYTKLIRKGKSLEEIIRDLRDALYRYPVEVPLWQSLGDAYMRANRLQEALDAYTKAEELLR
jgi:tetratricopeptide (TPR) repeat protein